MNGRGRPFERHQRSVVTSFDDVRTADRELLPGSAGLLRILAEKLSIIPRTGHSPDDYDWTALQ